MITKSNHVIFLQEPLKNISIDSIDNNLAASLNPMRVNPEEEKYDIESNNPENTFEQQCNENNIIVTKYNSCCCTFKQLMQYIVVASITAIILIVIQYIIYGVK